MDKDRGREQLSASHNGLDHLNSEKSVEMILALTLLFVVLSPGVLLTLPPVGSTIFRSGKTRLLAVFVHAVVFYLVGCLLLPRLEGFANTPINAIDGPAPPTPASGADCSGNILGEGCLCNPLSGVKICDTSKGNLNCMGGTLTYNKTRTKVIGYSGTFRCTRL